jgi:hypothetical protein
MKQKKITMESLEQGTRTAAKINSCYDIKATNYLSRKGLS